MFASFASVAVQPLVTAGSVLLLYVTHVCVQHCFVTTDPFMLRALGTLLWSIDTPLAQVSFAQHLPQRVI